ncbi:MAG: bifunctional glutamate N-acetyltransferase/amino-acid acetyltransferase ArgJ [Bacillota bacterium]|jgi:glutamate N-acetyltransferase/amino-acid N-acetyltransferase
MVFNTIPGGITAAPGFQAAGVHAGIKKSNKTKPDIAIIFSETPAVTAGVFTQNYVKAAPVLVSQQVVSQGIARAVVINSGNANACTGDKGVEDAHLMACWTAEGLGIDSKQVLVGSTGVIGHQLPMDRVKIGIKKAVPALSVDGGHQAAIAILTTDLATKEVAVQLNLGGTVVTIGGMAKGSGMIHPNMATMLAFITTDASIEQATLKNAVKKAADKSFNMITVDGDTSTNDMFVVLANGKAQNKIIKEAGADLDAFQEALDYVCIELAKMIAKDGEGASKLIEAEVMHAATEEDARTVAKAVVSSNLVKSAMFGEDANWGRILCSVGYSGARINPDKVDIWIASANGAEKMAVQGMGLDFDENRSKEILKEKEIRIIIDLNEGTAGAKAWGCDLTYDYIKINADYRT